RISIETGNPLAWRQIIDALGPGIASKDRHSVRGALLKGQLHRVITRIDVLEILLDIAKQGLAGNCVKTPRSATDRRRIEVQSLSQVAAVRPDIGAAHQYAIRELVLERQVPVVNCRNLVLVHRVPRQDELIQSKYGILRRREPCRQRIDAGLRRAVK